MVISSILVYYDEIDYVWYPIRGCGLVTYRVEKGGGGSGIGGIKSTMEIHEFCIVRSLKLCTFLGCKWGVPLVIGGGGGGGEGWWFGCGGGCGGCMFCVFLCIVFFFFFFFFFLSS